MKASDDIEEEIIEEDEALVVAKKPTKNNFEGS